MPPPGLKKSSYASRTKKGDKKKGSSRKSTGGKNNNKNKTKQEEARKYVAASQGIDEKINVPSQLTGAVPLPAAPEVITGLWIQDEILQKRGAYLASFADGQKAMLYSPRALSCCVLCSNFQTGHLYLCNSYSGLRQHWDSHHCLLSDQKDDKGNFKKLSVAQQSDYELCSQVVTNRNWNQIIPPVSDFLLVLVLFCATCMPFLNSVVFYCL
jgi:hypothetical protein